MRIVSKEEENRRREVVRGERQRCWTGLRCLTLICIFYDASSCQSEVSHCGPHGPIASCGLFHPPPSHHVYMPVIALSLTVMVRMGQVEADQITLHHA